MKRQAFFRVFTILFLAILHIGHSEICANEWEDIRHHVILSIDEAGCSKWNTSPQTVDILKRVILFNKDYLEGRSLFETGDYISVVGFSMDITQENGIEMFVNTLRGCDNQRYWSPSPEELKDFFLHKYPHVANNFPHKSTDFSLVSIAKPYTLRAVANDNVKVNRTFIVQVTDHHYNGNDFYDEVESMLRVSEEYKKTLSPNYRKMMESVLQGKKLDILKKCYDVEGNYLIKWIDTRRIDGGKGQVEIYEAVPLQRNFTLPAAIDYPERVIARRLHSGDYKVEIPLHKSGGSNYGIERTELSLGGDTVLLQQCDTTVTFTLPHSSDADKIHIRAWLRLNDGFYNATVMSPVDAAPDDLGRIGLNRSISVEREPNAKVAFFDMPAFLWLPFFDSQYEAALFWKILISVVIIVLCAWYLIRLFSKPQTYTPTKADFIKK